MQYKPRQPTRNVNVSDRHPLREFGQLLIGLVIVIAVSYAVLGYLVDVVVDRLSTETELALYNKINLPELANQFINPDQSEEDLVSANAIMSKLSECADLPYPVTLYLNDSQEINASAFPGGVMAINRGLLDKINTEQGLAFVLAHELSHFKNRDHLRSVGRGVVFMSAISIMTGNNADISGILSPSVTYQFAQYSQSRESLADHSALNVLYCSYGSIEGATELFNHFLELEEGSALMGHYFSSHPETRSRLQAIAEFEYRE